MTNHSRRISRLSTFTESTTPAKRTREFITALPQTKLDPYSARGYRFRWHVSIFLLFYFYFIERKEPPDTNWINDCRHGNVWGFVRANDNGSVGNGGRTGDAAHRQPSGPGSYLVNFRWHDTLHHKVRHRSPEAHNTQRLGQRRGLVQVKILYSLISLIYVNFCPLEITSND